LFDCSFKIFGPFPCEMRGEMCLNTAISNPFCPKFTYFSSILLIAFADSPIFPIFLPAKSANPYTRIIHFSKWMRCKDPLIGCSQKKYVVKSSNCWVVDRLCMNPNWAGLMKVETWSTILLILCSRTLEALLSKEIGQ